MNETILNGKKLTQEEFEKEKAILKKKKGVRLKEIKPNEYKTEIRG